MFVSQKNSEWIGESNDRTILSFPGKNDGLTGYEDIVSHR